MSDESDIEEALKTFCLGVLYPNGTSSPSVTGYPYAVMRGWPLEEDLRKDMAAGITDVSFFARAGVEQVTTRYSQEWRPLVAAVRTVTVSVSNNIITFGGTISTPQNVGVVVGRTDGFQYSVQSGDTLASIATNVAALINVKYPGTVANGVSITVAVPTAKGIQARIGGAGTMYKELKRQNKAFQVTIWAPAFEKRDAAARVLDPALAALNFITPSDGVSALVRYERTITSDTPTTEGSYRRDLFYWVEYPTIQTQTFYEIVLNQIASQTGPSPLDNPSGITWN